MNDNSALPQIAEDAITGAPAPALPAIGVVIVSFNSGDVLLDCLETLMASEGVRLHVVVVDNASTDDTVDQVRAWAAAGSGYRLPDDLPFVARPLARPVPLAEAAATMAVPAAPGLLVLHAGVNGGYAGGVNAGLACLAATPGVDRFWVLNPDSAVPPQTARHFATEGGPQADFALMGGRVLYLEDPDRVQIDGGLINWRTGATRNVNQGARAEQCTAPDPAAIDFISGASMVASRRFYEKAGPMAEDYFLYYEEVDWAMQRGAMPLAYCRDARVYHRAGTAIGSAKPGRVGSPLAIFFMHRNRIRFLQRYRPSALASGYLFSLGKAAQLCLKGHLHEARVLLAASFLGRPTQDVRGRLAPRAAEKAFAPAGQTGTSRQNDADRPSRP